MVSPNEINTVYTDPSFEQFQSQITSQEEMDTWLQDWLEEYLYEGSTHKFAPLSHMLQQTSSFSGDLEEIYKWLQETHQLYMISACCKYFSTSEVTQESSEIFSQLISFFWHISADTGEIVYNKLKDFDVLEKKHLFHQALDFLISYDKKTKYTHHFTQKIATSSMYEIVHRAQCIFVALCASNPDDFLDYMNLLREPLHRNFETYQIVDQTRLCEDIIHAIGMNRLDSYLSKLDSEKDAWFIECAPMVIWLEKQKNQKKIEEILKNIVPNIFTIEEFFRSVSEHGEGFSLLKNLLGDDIYDTQWDICTIDIQERVKLFESIYINLEILFGEDTKRKQTWMYLSHDRLDNNTLWDLLESGDKENLSRAVTFMHGVVSW